MWRVRKEPYSGRCRKETLRKARYAHRAPRPKAAIAPRFLEDILPLPEDRIEAIPAESMWLPQELQKVSKKTLDQENGGIT